MLAIIFYLVSWLGYYIPKYNYQVGQIAPVSIKAPFTFRVLKSDQMIDAEAKLEMDNLPPIYKLSEETNFKVLQKIDNFFIVLNSMTNKQDTSESIRTMSERGYLFNFRLLEYLLDNTTEIYDTITKQYVGIMSLPIVDDKEKNKVFRMSDSNKTAEHLQASMITKSEAKNRLISGVREPLKREVILDIAEMFIETNLIIDIEAQAAERENIKRRIDPVVSRVEKNDFIIRKNERLEEQDILKLTSLRTASLEMHSVRNYQELIMSAFGQFLYNLVIFVLYLSIMRAFFSGSFVSVRELIVTYSTFLAMILVISLLYYVFDLKNIILIPIPLFILTISILFSSRFGISFILFTLIITGQYLFWNMLPLINLVMASLVCLYIMKKQVFVNYLQLFFYLLASLIVISLITSIFQNNSFPELMNTLLFCLINASVSILGAYFLVPYLQKKMKYATKEVLLSLIDSNNPLLKKLAREAPGTYYHCLTVGVLAEECAEAISADSMIARIGSYYHDIGKLENPEYFIENIIGENKHDTLPPVESANIIRNHVKTGALLGQLEKLPIAILDIIKQHHGDSKIKYFLHKAKESGEEVNTIDFEYPGPKPQTKEAVIVMICDIIESTVKSAKHIDETVIKKIIDETINNLFDENQLNEAPITVKELITIKQTIQPILLSIHKRRIEYPENK
ncbi:MAG: HDIG domain-containing protein [Candidatus Cloacimonetes bacterium]|nr:HDIG domain-containing protein [Candidatus Cloacimonadota bacterium]